jgi:phytoene synthase
MTDTEQDLDALVRRVDPDRWLASRFAPSAQGRADLIALYALNHELARVAETVTTPLLGEIRLAWWREALEALEGGAAPTHPVLVALGPGVRERRIAVEALVGLAEARNADLEPAPFPDEQALAAYIDGTAGALMSLAGQALDRQADPSNFTEPARAWAWAGLLRSAPLHAARGWDWKPRAWTGSSDAEAAAHVRHRAEAAMAEARKVQTPAGAFAAVAYATLVPGYLRRGRVGELEKRLRLVGASLRGRV